MLVFLLIRLFLIEGLGDLKKIFPLEDGGGITLIVRNQLDLFVRN